MKYLLIFILFMIPGIVWPGGYHKTVNNYYSENVTNITNHTGVSSGGFNSGIAQLLAGDAIHCTTSTRKHQAGIGTGYSNGKNGFAIGGCKTFLREGSTPMMIGIKAMGANDAKPVYSLGVNWTW